MDKVVREKDKEGEIARDRERGEGGGVCNDSRVASDVQRRQVLVLLPDPVKGSQRILDHVGTRF